MTLSPQVIRQIRERLLKTELSRTLEKSAVVPAAPSPGVPPDMSAGMPPGMGPAAGGAGAGGAPPISDADLMALLGLGGQPPAGEEPPAPPTPSPEPTAPEEQKDSGTTRVSNAVLYAELVKIRKLLLGVYRQAGYVIPEEVLEDEDVLAPGAVKPPPSKNESPEASPEQSFDTITSVKDLITQPTGPLPSVGGQEGISPVQPIT